MPNKKIREYASDKSVRLWQIAYKMGMTDSCFSRKLRIELNDEETSKIMFLIDQIAREKESED